MSELSKLFVNNVIALIDDDEDFHDCEERESFSSHLGFPHVRRQSLVIKAGKKVEEAITGTILEYAAKHGKKVRALPSKMVWKGHEFQADQVLETHHAGQGTRALLVETRMNPQNDTGKNEGTKYQTKQKLAYMRHTYPNHKLEVYYATDIYESGSAQNMSAARLCKKFQQDTGERMRHINANNLITVALGVQYPEFSDDDWKAAIAKIGDYIRKP